MDKKVLFNETLTSLVEFAAAKGNEISMDDVKLYFKDLIEDESQYHFIYDYLAINKIKIGGFEPTVDDASSNSEINETVTVSDTVESEEELAFIDMYMKELEAIPPVDENEKTSLVSLLLEGNLDIVDRLIECHLSYVAELAQKYRGRGVTFGDLIQEGNIGLMLGISEYSENSGDFHSFITEKITGSLEETENSQINSDRIGQRLADRLNRLDSVTKDLSEKLGRVPEISELAEAMNITEEEASHLLKISLDTLSVNEDTQIASAEDSTEENGIAFDTAPAEDPLQWRVNKK